MNKKSNQSEPAPKPPGMRHAREGSIESREQKFSLANEKAAVDATIRLGVFLIQEVAPELKMSIEGRSFDVLFHQAVKESNALRGSSEFTSANNHERMNPKKRDWFYLDFLQCNGGPLPFARKNRSLSLRPRDQGGPSVDAALTIKRYDANQLDRKLGTLVLQLARTRFEATDNLFQMLFTKTGVLKINIASTNLPKNEGTKLYPVAFHTGDTGIIRSGLDLESLEKLIRDFNNEIVDAQGTDEILSPHNVPESDEFRCVSQFVVQSVRFDLSVQAGWKIEVSVDRVFSIRALDNVKKKERSRKLPDYWELELEQYPLRNGVTPSPESQAIYSKIKRVIQESGWLQSTTPSISKYHRSVAHLL